VPAQRRTVSNPADLLLRIARTPEGLRISSPQLPCWSAHARGPVPIAQAIDSAFTELACALYAADRGQPYDLAVHDVAAAKISRLAQEIRAEDVAVVAAGAPRRESGAPITRHGVNGPRHDPFQWIDLGNGFWQSPAGHRYPDTAQVVQRVIAARTRADAAPADCPQLTLDDVAS
jgi:hypothetical protein